MGVEYKDFNTTRPMKTNLQSELRSETARWLRGLFALPEKPKPTAAPETASTPVIRMAPPNGKAILLVDDDPVFLKATAMKLESNGYEVLTAKDGSEAIQVARRKKPDLLVLDVNLTPDVASGGSVPWDGFRIMSWLRRFDEFKRTPVVITSVGDPVQSTRLALGAGAAAFFHKQMSPSQLLDLVKGTLERSNVARTPALELNFQI